MQMDHELITLFFFYLSTSNKIQIKQHGNVTLLQDNGSTITRVPLDVLSTELVYMACFTSNQYFCV